MLPNQPIQQPIYKHLHNKRACTATMQRNALIYASKQSTHTSYTPELSNGDVSYFCAFSLVINNGIAPKQDNGNRAVSVFPVYHARPIANSAGRTMPEPYRSGKKEASLPFIRIENIPGKNFFFLVLPSEAGLPTTAKASFDCLPGRACLAR